MRTTLLLIAALLVSACSSSLTKHMEATGKIPEGVNMAYCYQIEGDSSGGIWTQTNVWLGVSVENQATANERIPLLLETPAVVRWLSVEPMLESISLTPWDCPVGDVCGSCEGYRGWGSGPDIEDCRECDGTGLDGESQIHWIVCGGESGTKARPMSEQWARDLRCDCMEQDIPFFMKQGSQANWPRYKDFDSFPANLQVREYPV